MGLKRFDYRIKDNRKKKSIIATSIIVLVLLIGIGIYVTFAAYKVTKTYNVIQGKVGDFVNADLAITVKVIDENGNETTATDFPSSDEYFYVADKSSCSNGSTIKFDLTNWTATITSSTKDKCTLYFESGVPQVLSKAILANNTLITTAPDFNTVTAIGEYGLYSAQDDYGISYYFRGDVKNNYVVFGSYTAGTTVNGITYANETAMYWRIVRINGDGTIRLVYDGTELKENGIKHSATIASSVYNTNWNAAKYVGYTYDDGNGNQVDSDIKGVVDAWYINNLEQNYGKYIADRIFCNDREVTSTNGTTQYYGAYDRLETNKSPVLTCTNQSDRYTVEDTTKGNGLLTKPVGLMTADEVAMAGGKNLMINSTFYLYTGTQYKTMSPGYFNGAMATVWDVNSYGTLGHNIAVRYSYGVRPVINLKADSLFAGTGTTTAPYRLAS